MPYLYMAANAAFFIDTGVKNAVLLYTSLVAYDDPAIISPNFGT
jgi:hypothetical protein